MNSIRVLLVDKCKEFLKVAGDFLAEDPAISVVGRLNTTQEIIDRAAKLTPDCVVIELEMPGMNGLLATLHLKALSRPPRVIILTNRTEPAYRALAEAVQVDGFVGKDKMLIDLLPLIKDWNGTKVIKE